VGHEEFDAIVLAGGRAARMAGADKAALEVAGATLLDHALRAVAGARTVVVVGDERPTAEQVVWTRERPAYGGPVAAAYAGRDALDDGLLVVLAVDMPAVTPATVARLLAATEGDGAVLVEGGRRHLAFAVQADALDRVRPHKTDGAAMRDLWSALDLAEVPAHENEARDVDQWSDLAPRGWSGPPD
jgi:molybdopterin-guanine dinucleotide biosynthesis protein A